MWYVIEFGIDLVFRVVGFCFFWVIILDYEFCNDVMECKFVVVVDMIKVN